jgi:hypothetical protein
MSVSIVLSIISNQHDIWTNLLRHGRPFSQAGIIKELHFLELTKEGRKRVK